MWTEISLISIATTAKLRKLEMIDTKNSSTAYVVMYKLIT